MNTQSLDDILDEHFTPECEPACARNHYDEDKSRAKQDIERLIIEAKMELLERLCCCDNGNEKEPAINVCYGAHEALIAELKEQLQ